MQLAPVTPLLHRWESRNGPKSGSFQSSRGRWLDGLGSNGILTHSVSPDSSVQPSSLPAPECSPCLPELISVSPTSGMEVNARMTHSRMPAARQRCKGRFPRWSGMLGSAPAVSSTWTQAAWPAVQASCRAVRPSGALSGLARHRSSSCRTSVWPRLAATCRGVVSSSSYDRDQSPRERGDMGLRPWREAEHCQAIGEVGRGRD